MNPVLNLVYPEKSDIKYEITHFPDGQQQVIIGSLLYQGLYSYSYCTVAARLNNFFDLEILICAIKSLSTLNVQDIYLEIPYFLGCRSDRQFEFGSNNYLKDVICPIINSLNLKSITVLDPHSDVLEACLNNYHKKNNYNIVEFALMTLGQTKKGFNLISPDAGANKKIYSLAEQLEFKSDVITCSKHRDSEGKITKTIVPPFDITKDSIIVDDICDGGRTFIEIAKVIKERHEQLLRDDTRNEHGKIYLIVTHGIFSKGYKELNRYFDGIFCTNSYKDVLEFEWDGDKKDIPTNVKQLNIF